MEKDPDPSKPQAQRTGAKPPNPMALMGAGMELGGVVAVLALLGWWLDQYFGTSPWLVLSGTAVGIIGGIYNLWKQGKRYF